MIVLGLVLPLGLGLVFWFRALDQNPDVSIPTPIMPAPNARDYYINAAGAVVDGNKIGFAPGPWNPANKPSGDQHFYSMADKAKLVTENDGAIQTLHTGFQLPYQETPVRSFNAEFPHYTKMRGLARLLFLKAEVEAGRGDWNGAINADLDAVQLGETMPHGGPLIGMLVGVACQAIGRKQAWSVAGHLNAVQAKAAAQRLAKIRLSHVPYADTLEKEKWEGQASLLELMHRSDWSGALASAIAPNLSSTAQGSGSFSRWAVATRIRLTGKRKILANYTNALDQQIADARRPYAVHLPAPEPALDPVNEILIPDFGNARLNEVKADAENALLMTTLALRTYKLDQGVYPTALPLLVPAYLHAIPSDPFALSGQIRYKRMGTKYLLYSVGPDGIDNGGTAIFDKTKPAPTVPGSFDQRYWVQEDSRGDIVAGVNR